MLRFNLTVTFEISIFPFVCAKKQLRVDDKLDKFHFTLETVGSRPPQDILREAIIVLRKKFADLEQDVRDMADRDQD